MVETQSLKIFISVDMEGITGVIHWNEVDSSKNVYEHFREIMTNEANAAIEGALAAGATEIVVRDAHGSARNLLPGKLRSEASLIRNWAGSPFSMMEGIDDSFDAVCFIGYHAQAGTPNATLKHTMSGRIYNLKVNGEALPEAGWNALIAARYQTPVVFVSGDNAICEYAKEAFPNAGRVAVKNGIGQACQTLAPEKSVELIRSGVQQALENRDGCKLYSLGEPYFVEIEFSKEEYAAKAAWYPGAERVENRIVGFQSHDFLDCMTFYLFCS